MLGGPEATDENDTDGPGVVYVAAAGGVIVETFDPEVNGVAAGVVNNPPPTLAPVRGCCEGGA